MLYLIRKYPLFFLLLALALPALGCGILPAATATATPPPPPTDPPPTETATVPPTLTFVEHEEASLGLHLRYPDSWEISVTDNSVVVASDVELLSVQQFDREGAGALIVVGPADAFAGDTLEEALNAAVQQFSFTDNDRIVEGPLVTTVNGQEAVTATIEGSDAGSEQTLVVLVTLLRNGDRAAFISGVTLQRVLDQYRETLETVANSIVLQDVLTIATSQSQGTLQYGQTINGQIEPGRDASWTFIGVEGERIDITVRPLQEGLDVTVDVQNLEGASILPDGPVDDAFGVETIRGLALPGSTQYTIVVSGFAQSSGAFELAIGEAGALTSAQSITTGDMLNGVLEVDEQDDYLFSSEGQDPVTIVVNPVGDLDVVLEVLSVDGNVIFQQDSSYGQEQLSFTPDAVTDYILRVRGYAGAGGDYAISLQAGGVGSKGSTLITSASLDENDSEGHDFPFTVDQGEVVQAIVSPDGDFDVVVEVWNDDTQAIEDSVDASYGREQVTFTASQAGNYYFKVLGFEGQGGTYTISLSGSPGVIFELLAGDLVDADMGQSAYIDYYIRLDSNTTLRINATPDEGTDIVVELLDLSENLLAQVDDGFSGEAEQLSYTAPESAADGETYVIRLRNFTGEPGGTFSLTIE